MGYCPSGDKLTILFRNALVLTMDPSRPIAESVLVDSGKIVWVGDDGAAPDVKLDRIVDCTGGTLLPGLNDAHIHLLGYAASLAQLDFSHKSVSSIEDVKQLLLNETRNIDEGYWIRGRGYDEFYLKDARHITRMDLDEVSPRHPVRIDHRSGHASVLNSKALKVLGIGIDTIEPPEGVICRDESGFPTGLMFEMHDYLSELSGASARQTKMKELLDGASLNLLQWGITSLQDASPRNDIDRWDYMRLLQDEGIIRQRITMMPGIKNLSDFLSSSDFNRSANDKLHIGAAKLMITCTAGNIYPYDDDIRDYISTAHGLGFSVAIHAVEEEAIIKAIEILSDHECCRGSRRFLDRIEHCSESTPKVQALLHNSNISIVTQPTFIYESATRYKSQVPINLIKWIYPLRTLSKLGINIAAGSDAPIASPNPWHGIYGAMVRSDALGSRLGSEESLSLENSLSLYTSGAAAVSACGDMIGSISPGKLADMALVNGNLLEIQPYDIIGIRSELTLLDGIVVWEK